MKNRMGEGQASRHSPCWNIPDFEMFSVKGPKPRSLLRFAPEVVAEGGFTEVQQLISCLIHLKVLCETAFPEHLSFVKSRKSSSIATLRSIISHFSIVQ